MKKTTFRTIKSLAKIVPIPEGATARRCFHCPAPASFYQFTTDSLGAIDTSSRRPACAEHRKTV